jgi:hypothetical protein
MPESKEPGRRQAPASEAIQNNWENQAGTTSKHGLSPKAGETYGVGCPAKSKTEQRVFAFQLIELETDNRIRE